MIMDGLDTLSQVALADQLNLSFDSYHPPSSSSTAAGQPGSNSTLSRALVEGLIEGLEDSLNTPNNLNTPGTTSDVNFNFSSDFDAALPITGEYHG